jgi:hypothetical protein
MSYELLQVGLLTCFVSVLEEVTGYCGFRIFIATGRDIGCQGTTSEVLLMSGLLLSPQRS